jgi:hypothetical protein
MPGLEDFDRYVAEHGIPREHCPAGFALWIAEKTGGPCRGSRRPSVRRRADGVVIEGDDV